MLKALAIAAALALAPAAAYAMDCCDKGCCDDKPVAQATPAK